MKQNGLLPITRLASSLALFGVLLCMHMSFTLAHFLPTNSKNVMYAVYIFYFAGISAGAVLCPLFLPVPAGKSKHPFVKTGFIAFLIMFEFILRSFGFQTWLNSYAVRSIMAIPEGILTSACYGLFYLSWLRRTTTGRTNRTGRFCSFVLGAILLGSVLACYYSIPLLKKSIAAENPLKGAAFVFNFIKWCMIIFTGIFSVASAFLARNTANNSVLLGENKDADGVLTAPSFKTDWSVIFRLVGIASMFTILNGVMDMRALPLYTDSAVYHPHYLIVAAAVPVLGFLAGFSINRFIRRFLLPVIIIFILFSCLPLFEDHPRFNMIMSTLISISHYTAWVVFTTAIVELYSGGFWFYGISTAIFFSVVFAFLSPLISPFVPHTKEFRALFIIIAVVFSMLIALRWLLLPILPHYKTTQREKTTPAPFETTNLDDIFKQHELSKRETEVANLMLKEGLGKNEIGERLCIAPGTAKIHISNIYQKFDVINRGEFMALFVKIDKI